MTLCRAVLSPFTYPVDPTTMALTCSLSDPFFTVRDCAPDVVPVSPSTWMVTPDCVATEVKWTPWLPTALSEARYSVWALGVAAPAAPGPRGERGQRGERAGAHGGGRGMTSVHGAHGAHGAHSPEGACPAARGAGWAVGGRGTSSRAIVRTRRRPGSTPVIPR